MLTVIIDNGVIIFNETMSGSCIGYELLKVNFILLFFIYVFIILFIYLFKLEV